MTVPPKPRQRFLHWPARTTTGAGTRWPPVPGNPAALALALAQQGKLSLAQVLRPAIELAEEGFVVTPAVAADWEGIREELARHPGAMRHYLKPDNSPYQEGDVFRHPRLARVLQALAESGVEVFYRGWIAATIAREMEKNGGFVRAADLEAYRSQPAVLLRLKYRDYEIVSPARHDRGSTLVEMLSTLSHFVLREGVPTGEEVELVARTIAEVFADRPSILEPVEPEGLGFDPAASEQFARKRAERIRQQLRLPIEAPSPTPAEDVLGEGHETTHLSVMDAEGNAVALTTSIGPRFGTRVASPELGFIYAHSYRMRSRPLPRQRDYTEMTPTIVLRQGKPVLVVGAAGGARIPGAIFQVLSNVIDRGFSLEEAVAAPRVYCRGSELQMHARFSLAVLERMRARGFELELITDSSERHLGRVHAVGYNPESGEYVGVAAPAYDGTAAGPDLSHSYREPDHRR